MRTQTRAQWCAMLAMADSRNPNAVPGDYLLAIAGLEPLSAGARDAAIERARVSDITAAFPGTAVIDEFGCRCVI